MVYVYEVFRGSGYFCAGQLIFSIIDTVLKILNIYALAEGAVDDQLGF